MDQIVLKTQRSVLPSSPPNGSKKLHAVYVAFKVMAITKQIKRDELAFEQATQ